MSEPRKFPEKDVYLPRTCLSLTSILSLYVYHPMVVQLIGAYQELVAENEALRAAGREGRHVE